MKVYTSAAKWMCLLLAVSLFYTGMPIAVDSADDGTTASGTACYGYTTLNETEQFVYNYLHAAVHSETPDQTYLFSGLHFTESEMADIVNIYVSDHPEAFWFQGTFLYYYGDLQPLGGPSGNGVLMIPLFELNGMYFTDTYYTKANEDPSDDDTPINDIRVLTKAKADFENKFNALYVEMGAAGMLNASDGEKALWLHDKVTDIVTYTETPNDQTAYGAFVEGKAVCAGYTALYQYLLQKFGIRSFRVAGAAQSTGSSVLVSHAWNLVWIGDTCVYTDVTWDDAQITNENGVVIGEVLMHLYYALGYEDFYSTQHFADALYTGRLPQCTDNCDHLYRESLDVIPEGSVITTQALAARAVLSADGKSYSVKVIDQTDSVYAWVSDGTNRFFLAQMLGVEGRVEYATMALSGPMGTEVQLIFQFTEAIAPKPAVEGKIELGSISPDEIVRVSFIPEGSDTEVYGVQKYACAADYSVRNLPSGNYTVRVSAAKHVTREYTITVP